MNKELEQLGVDAIKGLLDTLTTAKAFAIEQAPEVVREIVLLGRVENTVGLLFALCFGTVAFWMGKKAYNCDDEMKAVPIGAGAFGVGCMALAMFFRSGQGAVMAWFAPRLYIIQTLKDML